MENAAEKSCFENMLEKAEKRVNELRLTYELDLDVSDKVHQKYHKLLAEAIAYADLYRLHINQIKDGKIRQ